MKYLFACLSFLLFIVPALSDASGYGLPAKLTLDECIETGLSQNQKKRISQLAVETAEYQYKQALSSFWPQIGFETGFSRSDEDINFVFPERSGHISVSGLGPLPITGQITIPEQNVTVMDRDNYRSSLQMVYPLFTGGLRSALAHQGKSAVVAAKQALRRTELGLIHDIKRMYYGAVLARRLADIGFQTMERLQATSELTETFYTRGAGTVTRRDYLRSRIVLESARTVVAGLKANAELATAALGNTMGLAWDAPVEPVETDIAFEPMDADIHQVVAGAYRFNPDWRQMAAALEIYEARLSEEKASLWPRVAVSGTLWRWDTSLDSGLATDDNKQGWSMGVGLSLPLFNGFLKTNKIKAAKAALQSMQASRILLKEGLGLQIKNAFIQMSSASASATAGMEAALRAKEHRELTERAYLQELVSTADLLESQIIEALTLVKSETARYDHAVALYQIEFLVGSQFDQWLSKKIN